jgi:hypothetical protein
MREQESTSYNDVLRRLLGLSPKQETTLHPDASHTSRGWMTKGVTFPGGTEFRATYKGKEIRGSVESGALVVNGKRFISASSAAVAVTENPVNGWNFWECKLPGSSTWQVIRSLRK